ncbi:MAG: hypothetical protein M8353_06095 [ANME-2 cluster archaeon]|nr:hypothetical protein [ANME-2 cluster archaeon]
MIVGTMRHDLNQLVKDKGTRSCIECGSSELDHFNRVYIQGELFSFPYCRQCGLVQWHVVSCFHLTLEKLYDLFLQLADELELPEDKILVGLEYIRKRKGDEGYSNDVVILKEFFGIV